MKIQYISDLHMEFGSKFDFSNIIGDVLVIAGDLHTSNNIINCLIDIDKQANKPIIFTPGNHDYYGATKLYVDELFEFCNKELKNIHILNNNSFTLDLTSSDRDIDRVKFIGSPGFWDGSGGKLSKQVIYSLNDFSSIYDIIPANYGLEWGFKSRKFFERTCRNFDPELKIVCISHNAPTLQSIPIQYKDSELNVCFVNDWETIIENNRIEVWIHGHFHNTVEYNIGRTKVVCNPYGYYNKEINKIFNFNQIVEV